MNYHKNINHYPSIYPSLQYKDCEKAIDWLKNTLGFTQFMVHKGEDDRIVHAELKFGNGLIMVSSTSNDGLNWQNETPGNSDISLVVSDRKQIDELYKTIKSNQGKVVKELQEDDYGKYGKSYGFTCADPENNRWSIGTYQPMSREVS